VALAPVTWTSLRKDPMLSTTRSRAASARAVVLGLLSALLLPAVATAQVPHASEHLARAAAQSCPGATTVPTPGTVGVVRRAAICLVNRERRLHRLPRLRTNPSLQRSAETYAQDMARQNFFAHVSPTGATLDQRIRRETSYLARAMGWKIGENIAWGTGERATPADIVDSWMHSAPHRRNILDPGFHEIGMGIAIGAPVDLGPGLDAATYANHFGSH
jgi:uncharacterized protein YkwD